MFLYKLLPKNKHDNSNLTKIKNLSDDDLSKIGKDLLEWLQDANYPIFGEVVEVIALRQNIFVDEISKVLRSDDLMWKYWILIYLFPKFNKQNILFFQNDLDYMIRQNSQNEEDEELLDLAKSFKI